MAIKNYTTTISASRSVSEIQEMLTNAGARSITVDNDENRQPYAIGFSYLFNSNLLRFKLMVSPEGVLKALQKENVDRKYQNLKHAANVAWRIKRDFIDAQLAIWEAGLVDIPELFIGEMTNENGVRLIDSFNQNSIKFIENK